MQRAGRKPAVTLVCAQVYWVGPLGGAALAALLHRWVLAPRRPPPRPAEELPLRDKPDL